MYSNIFVQSYIIPRCGPQPQLDYGLFDVRYTFLRSKLQGNIPGHIAPTLGIFLFLVLLMRLRVLTQTSALKVRYKLYRSRLKGNIPGHIAPTLAFPFLSGVDATSDPNSGFGFEG